MYVVIYGQSLNQGFHWDSALSVMMAVSHLSGSLLAQQVAGGGLDQPGEHEARAVALIEDHELVLEELPGEVTTQPPEHKQEN